MGRANLKIAVIGCEPKDCMRFSYGGARYDIRHMVGRKIAVLGERYQPLVHWPVGNIRDFPSTKNVDAVVIPGSPLNVDRESLENMEWMRKLVLDFIPHAHGKVPMLGICFGHQAIARAFGSEVIAYTRRKIFYEIGFEMTKLTDEGMDERGTGIFRNMSERFPALYSHFQYVAAVPFDMEVLALSTNHRNKSVQAFKIGDSTYGVQFHPDWDEHNLFEVMKERNEIIMQNIGVRKIITDVPEREDHKVLHNFLQLI